MEQEFIEWYVKVWLGNQHRLSVAMIEKGGELLGIDFNCHDSWHYKVAVATINQKYQEFINRKPKIPGPKSGILENEDVVWPHDQAGEEPLTIDENKSNSPGLKSEKTGPRQKERNKK